MADNLAAVDQPIAEFDPILYVLSGLGPKYEAFITSVTTWYNLLGLDDLYGILLNHKLCQEQIHCTSKSGRVSSRVCRNQSDDHSCSWGWVGGQYSRNWFTWSSQQQLATLSATRLVIQCWQLTSYHSFDHSYQGAGPPPQLTNMHVIHHHDLNWYLDTGATNHIVSDLGKPSSWYEYLAPIKRWLGRDQVCK